MDGPSTSYNIYEGHSTVRPPLFDGTNYSHWKNKMRIWIRAQDGNPNRLCREQGRDSIKQKSCHKKLATSSKIPSIGLGSFSQRVNARDDFGYEKNGGCNCESE
ncbi:hypothetical protein PIB30_034866 [Stylosanthes scabra]|uniref:DUF4219 domain-containing protein n=1 Tax=Stylosanthes scabra TaxID=79078 RepID=A0ABU6QDK1_9FABA|nr:hypothetical protein [Stylosanthes scabra]